MRITVVAYKGLSLAKSPLRPAGPRLWKRCSKPFFDDVDADTEAYIHTEGGSCTFSMILVLQQQKKKERKKEKIRRGGGRREIRFH